MFLASLSKRKSNIKKTKKSPVYTDNGDSKSNKRLLQVRVLFLLRKICRRDVIGEFRNFSILIFPPEADLELSTGAIFAADSFGFSVNNL